MLSELVMTETRDRVRVLRMNRPERLNALNTALTQALLDALDAADRDADVSSIILTGEGQSFCAGADVTEFRDFSSANPGAVTARADLTCDLHMKLQMLSKPIVSCVCGAAIGGGAGLAIGCDMMVAGSNLRFGYPEIRHGLVPAIVMTSLQRQIGRKKAFELFSLGTLLSATEVFALGLANRVVEVEAAFETAWDIASYWAGCNPDALSASKKLFYAVADLPFADAMQAGRQTNIDMRGFRT